MALDGEDCQPTKKTLSLTKWPDWMEGRTQRRIVFARSKSILSALFNASLVVEDGPRLGESEPSSTKVRIDPDLDLSRDVTTGERVENTQFEKLVKKWKHLRHGFGKKMEKLLREKEISHVETLPNDEVGAKIHEIYQFYRRCSP